MILLYSTLRTTTLTIPAGVYTLELIAPAHVDDRLAIFAVGAGWNLLITALASRGLQVVARFEWLIVVFKYGVLMAAGVLAVHALVAGRTAVPFSWAWFSWPGMGEMKGLMGGYPDCLLRVLGLGCRHLRQRRDHGPGQQPGQGGGIQRRVARRHVCVHDLRLP